MKIQIPHSPATVGETGGDLWLSTEPCGRVIVGVVGADVVAVDIDALIAALEAIHEADDVHIEHPAKAPLGLFADTDPSNDPEERDPPSA